MEKMTFEYDKGLIKSKSSETYNQEINNLFKESITAFHNCIRALPDKGENFKGKLEITIEEK